MKLLYIANARIPTEKAHGYQIAKMCEQYARQGMSVELIIPTKHNPITEDLFTYYGIEKNYRVRKIYVPDCIRLSRFIGGYAYWLQTILFSLRVLVMRLDDATVILTRHPEIVWIMKMKGRSVVYECHDWLEKKREKIYLYFLRKADCIVTTNSYIKKRFLEHSFQEKDIIVAPNGIDLKVFALTLSKEEAVAKLDVDEEIKEKLRKGKVLLYTGSYKTMGADKGIHDILEALALLEKYVYFVAVGGSEKDIAYYKKEAERLGVADKVYLLGRKDQKLLAVYQRAADVLLMPFPKKAHYEYFMSPLKTFEYMASGVPIVASDLPSIGEVLDDTMCVFCESGNARDLAEKIRFVLANKEKAAGKAKRAFEKVKKYTWEKRAKNILECMIGTESSLELKRAKYKKYAD